MQFPTGSSLSIQYLDGDPFMHDVGGGLRFLATGNIDTGTKNLPVYLEGRIFVPPDFQNHVPMRLIVIGHGNHGSLDDTGWYVKQLERNGLPPSACVAPSLSHGSSGGQPYGYPGASEENAWRMMIGAAAAANIPGLVDVNRIAGCGYSLGAAANVGTMCMAGQWGLFRHFRGGASMGVGVSDGVHSWPQSWQVLGITAPQVIINGQYDQYINHSQSMALVNSLVGRNIRPTYLIEYPGIDHFALPSLGQAWADAATALVTLTQ
jgi:hypothetical protein